MKSCTFTARVVALGMLIALAGPGLAQQAYPSKPIRFVIPFATGASTDPLVRLVGQKMTESWGQQVIVENRPGGGSIIGTDAVAKSAPDGYTLLQMSIVHVTTPLLVAAPYDPIKDFAPIGTLASLEYVLVVHPSLPAGNLQQFIALAKSKPGQLNYGSSGTGSMGHLGLELFSSMAAVNMNHIPYKSAGPALTDLLGGQIQLSMVGPTAAIPFIKTAKLRAIATSGTTRLSALPQVPTFIEAGLPGYEVKTWLGVVAPAGTPKEIIDKLSAEIARIMAMPDTKERLAGLGMEPLISSADQLAAMMKADMARFGKIIKAANIKAG